MASRAKKIGKKINVSIDLDIDIDELIHWSGYTPTEDDLKYEVEQFKKEIVSELKYKLINESNSFETESTHTIRYNIK